MAHLKIHGALIGAAFMLAGCSLASDALWPSLTAKDPRATTSTAATVNTDRIDIAPAPAAMPPLGNSNFQPAMPTPGQPTGTFVGQKVVQLRDELRRLQVAIGQHNGELQVGRGATIQHAQAYHGTNANIAARLQVGSTPGNPMLVQQWNQAQQQLDVLNGDIARMNNLASAVGGDSTMVNYLVGSVRAAYGLSGAVEEDHRQLAILEDETNKTAVLIDRLLNELSEDIARQTNYLGNERSNLTAMALAIQNGEAFGPSLGNRVHGGALVAPAQVGPMAGRGGSAYPQASSGQQGVFGGRKPLVVIRFDRPNVSYEQALYTAVSRALERRPDATFDLVAVAGGAGNSAQVALNSTTSRRDADKVMRSLTEMGLPANRVVISSTASSEAPTNEVHIYVR